MKAKFIKSEISDSICLKIEAENLKEQNELNEFFEIEKEGEVNGNIEFVIEENNKKNVILYKETI